MKTTIDISDSLFEEAKRCAQKNGVTLRSIVEEGLRTVIEQNRVRPSRFELRDGSVGGEGVVHELPWNEVRKLVYEGRGE